MKSARMVWVVVGIAAGWALSEALPVGPIFAQGEVSKASTEADRGITMATAEITNAAHGEAICLFDHETKRLAIYEVHNSGMKLLHVRNCKYDLMADSFDLQGRTAEISVADMKKLVTK